MAISSAKKAKRGRPRIDATPVNVRFPPDELTALDGWIVKRKDDALSRPEAVRQLVALAIKARLK